MFSVSFIILILILSWYLMGHGKIFFTARASRFWGSLPRKVVPQGLYSHCEISVVDLDTYATSVAPFFYVARSVIYQYIALLAVIFLVLAVGTEVHWYVGEVFLRP